MTLALAFLFPPGFFGGGTTPPVEIPCLITQAGEGIITQGGDPIQILERPTADALLTEPGEFFRLENDTGYILLG